MVEAVSLGATESKRHRDQRRSGWIVFRHGHMTLIKLARSQPVSWPAAHGEMVERSGEGMRQTQTPARLLDIPLG